MSAPDFNAEQQLPAIQNMLEGLDSDTDRIQAVATKLVQGVGASLDQDKSTVKTVKSRLNKSVSQEVKKGSGQALSAMGRRMRDSVVQAVDADEQTTSRIAGLVSPALPAGGGGGKGGRGTDRRSRYPRAGFVPWSRALRGRNLCPSPAQHAGRSAPPGLRSCPGHAG